MPELNQFDLVVIQNTILKMQLHSAKKKADMRIKNNFWWELSILLADQPYQR